jgi:hypothetical protein
MTGSLSSISGIVEPFPPSPSSNLVSDELNRILGFLRGACPHDAQISFDFDGQLRVHIDVRGREDVTLTESILPTLGAGLFHSVTRGATLYRPFLHRISAIVDR